MQVSIISRTSKAKYMKKMEKKILVLEIVWNQPNEIDQIFLKYYMWMIPHYF